MSVLDTFLKFLNMELLESMKEFFQLRWLRLEVVSILVLDSKVPNPMDEFVETDDIYLIT